MNTPLVLVGGGGHCKSVIDVIVANGNYEIIGILDMPDKVGSSILGFEIIGTDDDIPKYHHDGAHFIITTGQVKTSRIRQKIASDIEKVGGEVATIISPYAHVSPWAKIGKGSVVMHQAIINAEAVVKEHCIINNGALVEHEAIVESFCHISTHAVLNGNVQVGYGSFIGSQSVVSHGVAIQEHAVVGAGSVVVKNIEKNSIVVGNPARQI